MAITVNSGDVVSFKLVNTTIITNSFTNVKVSGTLSYDAAKFIDPELANKHYNLYPYFKDTVNNVDDPNAYQYVVVQLASGQFIPVGLPWISQDSFTTVGNQTATITITGWQQKYNAPLIDLLGNLGAQYTMTVK